MTFPLDAKHEPQIVQERVVINLADEEPYVEVTECAQDLDLGGLHLCRGYRDYLQHGPDKNPDLKVLVLQDNGALLRTEEFSQLTRKERRHGRRWFDDLSSYGRGRMAQWRSEFENSPIRIPIRSVPLDPIREGGVILYMQVGQVYQVESQNDEVVLQRADLTCQRDLTDSSLSLECSALTLTSVNDPEVIIKQNGMQNLAPELFRLDPQSQSEIELEYFLR